MVCGTLGEPDHGGMESRALALKVSALLEQTRARTLGVVEGLPDEFLRCSPSPLMSPLVWDLGHIAQVEEAWLLRALGTHPRGPLPPHRAALYEPRIHPRAGRNGLPLLGPAQVRAHLACVREQVLERLSCARFHEGDPLLRQGFVYGMVLQHEQQHVETMLATLALGAHPSCRPATPPRAERVGGVRAPERRWPGGVFRMGTSSAPWALDNERPAHRRLLPPFFLDTFPVTNAEYRAFIADDGYRRPELWSPEGWAHRTEAALELPLFWVREGPDFFRMRFGVPEALPPDEAVMHVCFHEAWAYARWAGRRLPTEAEWEYAASANTSGEEGAAKLRGLPGDVWEWTTSAFAPYPGFRPHPYSGYSAPFFDGRYCVLRGGSWATHPLVLRPTFRNWDFPIRRQIFAGFRCARDVPPEESA